MSFDEEPYQQPTKEEWEAFMNPKETLSWHEWEIDVRELARRIKEIAPLPKAIAGIARGGLLTAVRLSHLLSVPYTHTINAKAYLDDISKNTVSFEGALPSIGRKEQLETLFVDDIIDSGITIDAVAEYYTDAKFVAPVGKIAGMNRVSNRLLVEPTRIIFDKRWIVFPWEKPL